MMIRKRHQKLILTKWIEITEFVDNLTQLQFQKMQTFFETMPKLSHETEYTCSNCEHHQKLLIEGLQNFFA